MKYIIVIGFLIVAMIIFPLSYVAAEDAEYRVTIKITWNSVDTASLYELLTDTFKTHEDACKLDVSVKKKEETSDTNSSAWYFSSATGAAYYGDGNGNVYCVIE